MFIKMHLEKYQEIIYKEYFLIWLIIQIKQMMKKEGEPDAGDHLGTV